MMLYKMLPEQVILGVLQALWALPKSDQEWLGNNVKGITVDYNGSYEDQVAISSSVVRLNLLIEDRKRRGSIRNEQSWSVIRKWLDLNNAIVRNNSAQAVQLEKEFSALTGYNGTVQG